MIDLLKNKSISKKYVHFMLSDEKFKYKFIIDNYYNDIRELGISQFISYFTYFFNLEKCFINYEALRQRMYYHTKSKKERKKPLMEALR